MNKKVGINTGVNGQSKRGRSPGVPLTAGISPLKRAASVGCYESFTEIFGRNLTPLITRYLDVGSSKAMRLVSKADCYVDTRMFAVKLDFRIPNVTFEDCSTPEEKREVYEGVKSACAHDADQRIDFARTQEMALRINIHSTETLKLFILKTAEGLIDGRKVEEITFHNNLVYGMFINEENVELVQTFLNSVPVVYPNVEKLTLGPIVADLVLPEGMKKLKYLEFSNHVTAGVLLPADMKELEVLKFGQIAAPLILPEGMDSLRHIGFSKIEGALTLPQGMTARRFMELVLSNSEVVLPEEMKELEEFQSHFEQIAHQVIMQSATGIATNKHSIFMMYMWNALQNIHLAP